MKFEPGDLVKYNIPDGAKNIRFLVQYKDSVASAGVVGGGSGSTSGALGDNGAAGTLAVLPGMHRSTSDPMYILKFFEVE